MEPIVFTKNYRQDLPRILKGKKFNSSRDLGKSHNTTQCGNINN